MRTTINATVFLRDSDEKDAKLVTDSVKISINKELEDLSHPVVAEMASAAYRGQRYHGLKAFSVDYDPEQE